MLSPEDWHKRFKQQARWTAPLRRYLFDETDLGSAHTIIEVGCGTGALLSELIPNTSIEASPHIHGLDIDPSYLGLARAHAPTARLVQGDAHRLPYATASFDMAVCHFLLLWVDDPVMVLNEMRRLVRPGGAVLALAEPDYGGRIDYPDELSQLGRWQERALSNQGADTRLGRRLGAIMHQVGMAHVETGILGGQWRDHSSSEAWLSEWQVIHADLETTVDPEALERLRAIDQQACQSGERVLFVPTFYSWGRVDHI
jgi:SAM-dependent methyltransferase